MAGFKTGFAVGAVLVGAGAGWLLWKVESQPMMFPGKNVFSSPDYVSVTGSIVGDEKEKAQRPINNMTQMTCYKSDGTCQFLNANELGGGHMGSIFEDSLTIRKWDANEVIVDSLDLSSQFQGCMYYEIRVLLKSEDVTYTRLPNPKADKDRCVEIVGKTQQLRTWRIDDGEAFRRDE